MHAQGIAVLGLALWGFRPGAAWVWWATLLGGVASGAPTIVMHVAVGYVSFTHLAPVYLSRLGRHCPRAEPRLPVWRARA